MELDSQSMTPPSSPIIGYSGCNDDESVMDSGVVYSLSCKGAPRPHDYSFSPEGYILRREVISAIENLRNHGHNIRSEESPKLLKCFGHLLDPLDANQIRNMILLCRKCVISLEVLSESSHAYDMQQFNAPSDDPDDIYNQNPWTLRENVCQFLNIVVKRLKYYRAMWKLEQFHGMFEGLKKTLVPVRNWSSVLKTHCGFRNGNELEVRWSLFLIYGVNSDVSNWLLDELIQLAYHKYTNDSTVPLDEKQPFNCMCVKEIWTMVRLVIENLKPESLNEVQTRLRKKPFWNIYAEAMHRCAFSDPFFSIWLTSHLAQISDYCVIGIYRAGLGRKDSKENGNNGNQFIQGLFKNWVSRGGKSVEILRLSLPFFQYWGGECDILVALWTQWVPRLDRAGHDVSNFESYDSIDCWMKLISQICDGGAELCGSLADNNESGGARGPTIPYQQRNLGSNKDPFLEFVFLVAAFCRWATEKDIRRMKSTMCMKLSSNSHNTNDYGEIGIIRVSTLFMAMSSVIEFEREAVSMSERLLDIFTFGKGKNTPGRRKAILRAYSCMIIILLKKKISLLDYPNLVTTYIKTIDEILSNVSSDSSKKDLVMVYLDFLESLPQHTPSLCSRIGLGRHVLISSNLSMWFANSGHNYVIRTCRCLSRITEWIGKWIMDPNLFDFTNNSSEGKDLFLKISEKTVSFMKSVVILNSNRIPSTDVEPLANLAGDITLLTRTFKHSDEFESLFDLFGANERTCPLISKYFIKRLFNNSDGNIAVGLPKIKWIQTWIRLVSLDCCVPDELTEIVLNNGFTSTSYEDLLQKFCIKVNELDRDTIQNYLLPMIPLLKGVITATLFKNEPGQKDGLNFINSVITSCVIVLKTIKFDSLYLKGMATSVGHQFLTLLAPPSWPSTPPWEKYSPAVLSALERNLYDIFKVVSSHPSTSQDLFLSRKLQDIVVFSFFGFVKKPEFVDRDRHPAIRILDLSEEKQITLVQTQILPNVVAGDHVVSDLKLCQLFLSAVQVFRAKQLATIVMRVLAGVIRAFLIHYNCKDRQTIINCCVNAVVYCCLVGSSTSVFHKKLVLDGFKLAFEKEFLHRGKLVMQLCLAIAKSKNSTNGKLDARRFLKLEIIPMLKQWIETCEQRRGIGFDKSLREPLKMLEFETANIPVI